MKMNVDLQIDIRLGLSSVRERIEAEAAESGDQQEPTAAGHSRPATQGLFMSSFLI